MESIAVHNETVQAHFSICWQVDFGVRIAVCGSLLQLGQWDTKRAVSLTWSAGHLWQATIDLPANAVAEFKFVAISDNKEPEWEYGANRTWTAQKSLQPMSPLRSIEPVASPSPSTPKKLILNEHEDKVHQVELVSVIDAESLPSSPSSSSALAPKVLSSSSSSAAPEAPSITQEIAAPESPEMVEEKQQPRSASALSAQPSSPLSSLLTSVLLRDVQRASASAPEPSSPSPTPFNLSLPSLLTPCMSIPNEIFESSHLVQSQQSIPGFIFDSQQWLHFFQQHSSSPEKLAGLRNMVMISTLASCLRGGYLLPSGNFQSIDEFDLVDSVYCTVQYTPNVSDFVPSPLPPPPPAPIVEEPKPAPAAPALLLAPSSSGSAASPPTSPRSSSSASRSSMASLRTLVNSKQGLSSSVVAGSVVSLSSSSSSVSSSGPKSPRSGAVSPRGSAAPSPFASSIPSLSASLSLSSSSNSYASQQKAKLSSSASSALASRPPFNLHSSVPSKQQPLIVPALSTKKPVKHVVIDLFAESASSPSPSSSSPSSPASASSPIAAPPSPTPSPTRLSLSSSSASQSASPFKAPAPLTALFPEIRLIVEDLLDASLHFKYNQDLSPVVVIYGDTNRACGEYLTGGSGIEEQIVRRTNLAFCLADPFGLRPVLSSIRASIPNPPALYPIPDLGCIYSEDAVVFRASESKGYAFLPQPQSAAASGALSPSLSFLTVGGCWFSQALALSSQSNNNVGYLLRHELEQLAKKRLVAVLRGAIDLGHSTVVLQAPAGDSSLAANLFKQVLKEHGMAGSFENLVICVSNKSEQEVWQSELQCTEAQCAPLS